MRIWEKQGNLGHEVTWNGAIFDDFSVFISFLCVLIAFWSRGHNTYCKQDGVVMTHGVVKWSRTTYHSLDFKSTFHLSTLRELTSKRFTCQLWENLHTHRYIRAGTYVQVHTCRYIRAGTYVQVHTHICTHVCQLSENLNVNFSLVNFRWNS